MFEIPYNFDQQLIDVLYILDSTGETYHSIYIPPYYKDYDSAKKYYNHPETKENKIKSQCIKRKEYEEHIKYINQFFPNKIMLLLQQNTIILNQYFINYYLKLGITKFCVGSIEQAKIIKQLCPQAEITGSITMKISFDDIQHNKEMEQYIDNIVLWFPYNRNIDLIKKLPQKYKYILLVNCGCSIHCDGTSHWFADLEYEKQIQKYCPKENKEHNWQDVIKIRPMDLHMFTPYISYFKFQGREYDTSRIIKDICIYSENYSIYPGIDYNDNLYQN